MRISESDRSNRITLAAVINKRLGNNIDAKKQMLSRSNDMIGETLGRLD